MHGIDSILDALGRREQDSIDDGHQSMPALAPVGDSIVIGTGGHRGVLIVRDAQTGATLWQRSLYGGVFGSVATNSLSIVLAIDVDGRNGYDFLVGAADGWLYALNAAPGNLVWSLRLGYAVAIRSPLMLTATALPRFSCRRPTALSM